MIKFYIEKNSTVPYHTQLKEQIKIELAFGRLHSGDVLPSIREVEVELGIGRMFALRAYKDLARCGVLTLKQGRGAIVNHVPNPESGQRILQQYRALTEKLETDLAKGGINPTSFARYFYRCCLLRDMQESPILFADSSARLAQENAEQVSAVWELHVKGISLAELGAMPVKGLRNLRAVITNYYRYEEVQTILKKWGVPVVPVSFHWSQSLRQALKGVAPGAEVLMIQSQSDFERHAEFLVKELEAAFHDQQIRFRAEPFRSVERVQARLRSGKYPKIMISNPIWEELPKELRNSKNIVRPSMELSMESVLEARLEVGIVV